MELEQVTILRVQMEKRPGLLSQIVKILVKRGHIMESQRLEDTTVPGETVLSVVFKGDISLVACNN